MNKITDFIKNFFTSLKNDKKKMIIFIVVIVVLVLLLLPKGNKQETSGIGAEIGTVLNSDCYTVSGDITLCDYTFTLAANKSGDNYQAGFSNDDVSYKQLITRYNNNLYFNYTPFSSEENAGIASLRCAVIDTEDKKAEIPVKVKDLIFDSLNNSELIEYTNGDGLSEAKLTSEHWKDYFSGLAQSIKDNKASIISGYTDSGYISDELDVIAAELEKIGNSSSTENYLTITLSRNEDESYLLTVDSSIDYTVLPDFVDQDSFDSNSFNIYATLTYKLTDNSVNTPAGYVYSMNNDSIHDFVTACWNSIFQRKEFNYKNEITVKADSVTNVVDLGSTVETTQLLFDKDGCNSGVFIVSSYNKDVIISEYIPKYGEGLSGLENSIIYDENTGRFSLSFSLSDTALNSVNKIGTTPNAIGNYYKTAEGVIPLV